MFQNEKAQTLLEVVVVISVVVMVVSALVFATIASIRNASFAQNQLQATKLAQEGIEKVRTARDRNSSINFGSSTGSWSNPVFWSQPITGFCGLTPCYFKLAPDTTLNQVGSGDNFNFEFAEQLDNGLFRRAVILSDDSSFGVQKTVTVIVKWTDFSGAHESRLTTILRKI